MEQLTPYLIFRGDCKQALKFYRDCFNGEITVKQTFADANMDVPEPFKDKIFNSELCIKHLCIMASDSIPPYEIKVGTNFALFVKFKDDHELKTAYGKLAEKGNIIMPLENNFAMLIDRFGIQWMLSCP